MKTQPKTWVIVLVLALLALIMGIFSQNRNSSSKPETTEINASDQPAQTAQPPSAKIAVELPTTPAIETSAATLPKTNADSASPQNSPPPLSDFGTVAVTNGISITRTLVTGEICTIMPTVFTDDHGIAQITLAMNIYSSNGGQIAAPKISVLAGKTVRISVTSQSNLVSGVRIEITPYIDGTPPPEPESNQPGTDPFALKP